MGCLKICLCFYRYLFFINDYYEIFKEIYGG